MVTHIYTHKSTQTHFCAETISALKTLYKVEEKCIWAKKVQMREKSYFVCVCAVCVFAESDSDAWEEVFEDIIAEGESSTQQSIIITVYQV